MTLLILEWIVWTPTTDMHGSCHVCLPKAHDSWAKSQYWNQTTYGMFAQNKTIII